MGREASRELTPDEAKARLRAAAAKADIVSFSRFRPRDIAIGVFGLGIVAGFFPGLRKALVAEAIRFASSRRTVP